MSIVQNPSVVDTSNLQTELERTKEKFEDCMIKKENEYAKLWNDWYKKCEECKYDKISYDKAYNDMQQKIERLQAQLGDLKELEFQVRNYEKENAHLKTAYRNLFDSINVTRTQTKSIIDSLQNKLHDTIYKNAKLRAQLFDKVSEQKDTTKGTSVNTQFCKQSILRKPPSSSGSKLYAVTPLPKSTAIPKIGEMNTLSNQVTSNSVPSSYESKVVKNDNVIAPGMFRIGTRKNSRKDNFVPNKHVKASIRTKPITVSQPHVITKNEYVNGMNSHALNKNANVSNVENQKKHKANVKKFKKVGPKERLASPKPSTPRSCLRWSPTGIMFDLKGKIIAISESVCQSDCSKGDNACTSNPQEPICKRFPNSTFSMTGCQNWLDTLLIPLLSEYKPKDNETHGDNECDN
ncbi:retrovirus-related pol polyprotein from transposon TNT 1-94 [Tanacetum coccineum]